jgi:hypothetical protein
MAVSPGTTKGPSIRQSKAMQGPNSRSGPGPKPHALPGGKKMPHHGATGKKVVAGKTGLPTGIAGSGKGSMGY